VCIRILSSFRRAAFFRTEPTIGISFGARLAMSIACLKGTPIGSLPVQQPSRFLLVINLRAARDLGIEVRPAILALADELID
jgi:hypothetical protein